MPEKSNEVYHLMQRVNTLEVSHAKLETGQEQAAKAIEGLTESLKDLTIDVKELIAAINRGRGWANAFFWLSGGSFVGLIAVLAIMLGLNFTGSK